MYTTILIVFFPLKLCRLIDWCIDSKIVQTGYVWAINLAIDKLVSCILFWILLTNPSPHYITEQCVSLHSLSLSRTLTPLKIAFLTLPFYFLLLSPSCGLQQQAQSFPPFFSCRISARWEKLSSLYTCCRVKFNNGSCLLHPPLSCCTSLCYPWQQDPSQNFFIQGWNFHISFPASGLGHVTVFLAELEYYTCPGWFWILDETRDETFQVWVHTHELEKGK